ncbi:MAG: hypothetical protein ACOY3K_00650 [Candidatus Omnitrophota bacterium]
MKKKVIVVFMLALAFLTSASWNLAFAIEEVMEEPAIVDVGNKLCPVLGGEVNGKDFVVYEGKRYGLCCPMCKGVFEKDPVKYIAAFEASQVAAEQGEPAAG